MRVPYIHTFSAFAGFSLAVIGLVVMAQSPAASTPPWEYRIVEDVDDESLNKLAAEGWDYVGYLGAGVKGASMDETLWKRPQR